MNQVKASRKRVRRTATNVGTLALKSVSRHMEISSAGVSGVGYDDDRNVVRAYRRRLCIVFNEGYVFADYSK